MSDAEADVRERLGATLARVWDPDAVKLLVLVAGLFALYVAGGYLRGFGMRQQVNSVAILSFYIAVFAMLALALNLHWGYTGLFNIGVIGFMAVGIYTTAVLSKGAATTQPPAGSTAGLGLPLWLGILGGVLAAAIFGGLVALPALRLRADYFAIVTIGVSEIVRFTLMETSFQKVQVAGYWIGLGGGSGLVLDFDPTNRLLEGLGVMDAYVEWANTFGEQVGMGSNPKPVFDGLLYGLVLLVFLVGFYMLLQRVGNSPFGRVLKAIREDEDATMALGKHTSRFKVTAFMLGCALMGLGGILFYAEQGAITPDAFRPRITFYVWIALIIGGAGSNTGSVVGGALFAAFLFRGPIFLKNIIESFVDVQAANTFAGAIRPLFSTVDPVPLLMYTVDNLAQLQLVIMGIVLVYLMHNRPQGAMGHRKEPASPIDLSRPPARASGAPAADGGDVDGGDAGGGRDE